jgi:hypothetical protein
MARNTHFVSDPGLLEATLEGLQIQRERIEHQIRQVRALLGKRRSPGAPEPPTGRKRELSPAARKRIAAAQKKRWAEYRKAAAKQA